MISVIVPVLNEEAHIRRCLESLIISSDISDIVIADGGSTDRTIEMAEAFAHVKVIKSGKGRGLQMNAGASVATGEILLFLHADTFLEPGWSSALLSSLQDSSIAGGAFIFAIDNREKKYRVLEKWVRLRSSFFMLPYGDQGIFLRRELFRKLGGFANVPLMEDVDIIERMKQTGRIVILAKKAFTSERRWMRKGLLQTAVLNQIIMLLYRVGVSPRRLARLYYR